MYGTKSEEVINIVAFIQKEHKKKSKKRIYMLFKKDETRIDKPKQNKKTIETFASLGKHSKDNIL